MERLESKGDGSATATANVTVEVIARSGAQVKFAAIDRLGENVTAYISRRGKLGQDASIDWAIGVMNEVTWLQILTVTWLETEVMQI